MREYAQINLAMLRNKGKEALNPNRVNRNDFSLSFEDLENLLAIDQPTENQEDLDLNPIANFGRLASVNCDPAFINNADFDLRPETR